jgi:hypothetical protein
MGSVSCASAGSASQRAPRAVAARRWCAAPRASLPSQPPSAVLSAAAASAVPLLAQPWPEAVESARSPALQRRSPSAALALPPRAALTLHPSALFAGPCAVPLAPTASCGLCSTRRRQPQSAAAGRALLSAALRVARSSSAFAAPTVLPAAPFVSLLAVIATLVAPRPLCSFAVLCCTPSTARRRLPHGVLGGMRGFFVALSRVWGVPGAGCQALCCRVDPTARSSAAQRVRASRAARMAMRNAYR